MGGIFLKFCLDFCFKSGMIQIGKTPNTGIMEWRYLNVLYEMRDEAAG